MKDRYSRSHQMHYRLAETRTIFRSGQDMGGQMKYGLEWPKMLGGTGVKVGPFRANRWPEDDQ